MDRPTTLVYGYTPGRTKKVEALVAESSKPSDVLRLGPYVRIGQVRRMARFCSVAPIDTESQARTVVLYMEGMTEEAQNALLHILEEPPASTQFVLVRVSIHKILETILSRCVLIECRPPSYGQSVKDLTESGVEVRRAARIADSISRGYSMENVPTEHDCSIADALVTSGKAGDVEMGTSIAGTFEPLAVVALREKLLEAGELEALIETYRESDPRDTAILVLNKLVGKRHA